MFSNYGEKKTKNWHNVVRECQVTKCVELFID